ncbi:MAG: hypothetical protein HIU81_12060 [Acidobacteria bacterium]|nr:hypothetical protein [Acidobacteriota bacterium]
MSPCLGNTRRIALAIADGLAPFGVVVTANVNDLLAKAATHSARLLVLDDRELARARSWGASVGAAMEQFINH